MIKKRRIKTIFGMPGSTNSYGRGKTLTGCNFGFKLQVAFLLKYRNDVFVSWDATVGGGMRTEFKKMGDVDVVTTGTYMYTIRLFKTRCQTCTLLLRAIQEICGPAFS